MLDGHYFENIKKFLLQENHSTCSAVLNAAEKTLSYLKTLDKTVPAYNCSK